MKHLLLSVCLISLCGIQAQAQKKTPNFEKEVWPILKSRCIECHGAPKKDSRGRLKFAKAGLRLDGKDHILAGGVVVVKNPQNSMLVEYISLPPGDPDIMPPRGAPLTPLQVQTISDWIAAGADFGTWTGAEKKVLVKKKEAPKKAGMPAKIKLLTELGQGLEPLSAAEIKKILPGRARVEPVFTGSGLLRVSLISSAKDVGNDDLKVLAAMAPRIAHLNVGKSKVDDKGLKFLREMDNLVHLDLHKTAVSDQGLATVKSLKNLRYLNLYGTQVSDQGLPHLSMLKRLESLYLWQSKVTEAGIKRLKQVLPKTKISYKLELPAPAPPQENNRRRRRN